MTNRERLMQMSDEKLAELICRATSLDCTKCPACGKCGWNESGRPVALIAWLREEADND